MLTTTPAICPTVSFASSCTFRLLAHWCVSRGSSSGLLHFYQKFRIDGRGSVADFQLLWGIYVCFCAGSPSHRLPVLFSASLHMLSSSSPSSLMALPFIPVSPTQVAINIANKMGFVRQGLMARGGYLADPTILEWVDWEPHGRGQRLMLLPRPSVSPASCLPTLFPDSPDAVTASLTNDPSPVPNDAPAVPPPLDFAPPADPPTPAVLAIVTQLVPGQSWFYPDGRWTGPVGFLRNFTDIKLLCTGGAALHPRFASDYSTTIGNLNSIMGRIEDSHNERNTAVSGPTNYIHARHQLFVVCSLSSHCFPFLTSGSQEYEDADAIDPDGIYCAASLPPDLSDALCRRGLYPGLADVHSASCGSVGSRFGVSSCGASPRV